MAIIYPYSSESKIQSARLVWRSYWASAAGPIFTEDLRPQQPTHGLASLGRRRTVEWVSCRKKTKRATTK
jgi:hypothetical protein